MDKDIHNGEDYHYLPVTSVKSGEWTETASGIYCFTVQIVNVVFVGEPGNGDWVLVDAGMPKSADAILAAAEEHYGPGCKPACILLTHGHFDHVGALIDLINHWKVPVYAHEKELPYLTGKESYPFPDPMVGGLVSLMSSFFSVEPIDLGDHVSKLPDDGSVPSMPGWSWIHTPGHTPGHVSFFRDSDRSLIAGDAFVTVKQESLYKVIMQQPEISGPPRYLTTDWDNAKASVRTLEALKPQAAVTGHGIPLTGETLSESLRTLVVDFDRIAVPDHGKYVH